MIIAYKRPDRHSADDAALSVLDAVLSDGRTGIIYKDMVRDKQIALGAGSAAAIPRREVSVAILVFRRAVDGAFRRGEREGTVSDRRTGEDHQGG